MTAAARHLMLAAAFSGLAALSGVAAGQVVVLPTTFNSNIRGISDDGRRVAGGVGGNSPGYYFWDAANGYIRVNQTVSFGSGYPALSGDGHSLVGVSLQAGSINRAFLATDGGGITILPLSVPGSVNQGNPTGMSRDGSVVSGWDSHTSSSTQVGWRWSVTSGMQVLPGFNFTLSMSGDGRTIFGGNGFGAYGMWRDGVVSQVPGALGRVQAVNYDGSIFAGDGRIWNNGQIITMPLLPGGGNPEINDISEDGNVVVGSNLMDLGSVPIIWTPATGTQRLEDYFASFGYDLSGYRITNAHVSADGRAFGLEASSLADGLNRSILVTIPGPSAPVLLLSLIVLRRRAR